MRVIITLDISIVVPLTGLGETGLRFWKMIGENVVWMKMA